MYVAPSGFLLQCWFKEIWRFLNINGDFTNDLRQGISVSCCLIPVVHYQLRNIMAPNTFKEINFQGLEAHWSTTMIGSYLDLYWIAICTARQRGILKIMFSVMYVCRSVHKGSHEALDLPLPSGIFKLVQLGPYCTDIHPRHIITCSLWSTYGC